MRHQEEHKSLLEGDMLIDLFVDDLRSDDQGFFLRGVRSPYILRNDQTQGGNVVFLSQHLCGVGLDYSSVFCLSLRFGAFRTL